MTRFELARFVAALLIPVIAWHGASYAQSKRTVTEHFEIEYEGIPDGIVEFVIRDAEQAFRDVTTFLETDFAGPKIKILINENFRFPRSTANDATIRIPVDRLSPTGASSGPPPIRGRAMGFWHSVTNVVAPSSQSPAHLARFLQDGLAGYVQWKFGSKKTAPWPAKFYPTMGEAPHLATAEMAGEIGLLSLKDAIRYAKDRRLTRTRRLSWLQAASFVGYLIETRTLNQFKKWYVGGPFEKVYGADIGTVEREWANFIGKLKPGHSPVPTGSR